jgi:acetate kinase
MMRELARLAGPQAAAGKVVLAHLGGGCSVTGVKGGHSVDSTMGLTPAGGLMMATRAGDVDPGLAWRLLREFDVSAAQFNHVMNHESGLLGVSGVSGDINELLALESTHSGPSDAVAMFCYLTRKHIAAMAGSLEGIDTLVFSGGIGENLAVVRQRICAGLAFLSIEIDSDLNQLHAGVISTPTSRVTVRVVVTDEQIVIADAARKFLASANDADNTQADHE